MTVTFGDHDYALVMFDLDDTLAPSKSPLDDAMVEVLRRLLQRSLVCIISGGRYEQFRAQVLDRIGGVEEVANLHLMPTCGTQYVRYSAGQWETVYAEDLTDDEKQRTLDALETGAKELGLWETETWGPILEDRGSQITYSALGQSAPVDAKKAWDPDGAKKESLRAYAAERLPDLEVRSGGSTSVDVTRKGIDKPTAHANSWRSSTWASTTSCSSGIGSTRVATTAPSRTSASPPSRSRLGGHPRQTGCAARQLSHRPRSGHESRGLSPGAPRPVARVAIRPSPGRSGRGTDRSADRPCR